MEDVSLIVSTESAILSRPVDIALDDSGQLYVLDNLAAQILVLSADGELRRTIGRKGSGPREFKTPMAFTLGPDTLHVVDMGNGRIQTFALDGEFTRNLLLPLGPDLGPIAVSGEGRSLTGTLGVYDALAIYHDATGNQLGTLGTPPASASAIMSFSRMKEEIIAGKVPALFRNSVLPVFAPDGDMWLILNGEGLLQRYDSEGSLEVSVPLEAPEMERVWAQFVERTRETLRDPRRITGLSYVFDATVIGETLWILLNTPEDEPSVLMAFTAEGKVKRRVLFSSVFGARKFAFDRARGRIFFTVPSVASIVAASVPDSAHQS